MYILFIPTHILGYSLKGSD